MSIISTSASAALVTKVSTAQQLAAAMERGAPHVHITAHLDLRALSPSPNRGADTSVNLFQPGSLLKSLTVRLRVYAVGRRAW